MSHLELLSVQAWALRANSEAFGRDSKLVNGLELVRMCKWYMIFPEFPFGTWNKKNRTTFFEFLFIPENFHREEPKWCIPSTFQTEFLEILCKW